MNGTSGLQEVRSSPPRLPSNRLLHEQQPRFGIGSGTFSALTISSLSPQASAQSEKSFLIPFPTLHRVVMDMIASQVI